MPTAAETVPSSARLTAEVSDGMRLARVLCILGLVYVHVPPWFPPVRASGVAPFDFVFLLMQEGLGRASVPLLSVISGFLLVRSTAAYGAIERIRRKVPTLLMPLLLWNMIDVGVDAVWGRPLGGDGLVWINRFVALTDTPAMVHLYFLRDIFLCVLLYPLVAKALGYAPRLGIALLAVASVAGVTGLAFINPSILLFFSIGVGAASGHLVGRRFPAVALAFLALVFAIANAALHLPDLRQVLGSGTDAALLRETLLLGGRVAGAAFFWMLACRLSGLATGRVLARLEPYIFFFFCSHTLYLAVGWRVFNRLAGGYDDPLYPLFFLTAPAWTMLAALAASHVLSLVSPRLLRLLCGGRSPVAAKRHPGTLHVKASQI